MYPEDRVLVAFVPRPEDFLLAKHDGWYRIPQSQAPKGIHSEYLAFYFGRRFGEEKWAIHYYSRNQGHELVSRLDLLPNQKNHPRAQDFYYKVQLGPIIKRETPILSLRWRRVTFIHTTWDRFVDAREINDLFVEGGHYVDRLYATLKERGLQSERNYKVAEGEAAYRIPLMLPCVNGRVEIQSQALPENDAEVFKLAGEIVEEVNQKGGIKNFSPQERMGNT